MSAFMFYPEDNQMFFTFWHKPSQTIAKVPVFQFTDDYQFYNHLHLLRFVESYHDVGINQEESLELDFSQDVLK